jgi:hypothetical protein
MKVLLKHGTPAEIATYVGTEGELIVDDASSMFYIIDGVTQGGHPINGINYNIYTPSIIAPLEGATGVTRSPIIQSDAFSGDGSHYASYWEVATDIGFTNIVHSSGRDTVNLLQYNLSTAGVTLDPLTVHYVRVQHESNFGVVSAFSIVVSFTTTDS